MKTYQEHCHIRPDFENPYRYCVDHYAGNGHWTGSSLNLTKQEAKARMKREQRRKD